MRRIIFLIAASFIWSLASPLSFAQHQMVVTGSVKDNDTHLKIDFAVVEVVNTSNSVLVDSDGHYSIVVPAVTLYHTLHASAGENWEPKDETVMREVNFLLQFKHGSDAGHASFWEWLSRFADVIDIFQFFFGIFGPFL